MRILTYLHSRPRGTAFVEFVDTRRQLGEGPASHAAYKRFLNKYAMSRLSQFGAVVLLVFGLGAPAFSQDDIVAQYQQACRDDAVIRIAEAKATIERLNKDMKSLSKTDPNRESRLIKAKRFKTAIKQQETGIVLMEREGSDPTKRFSELIPGMLTRQFLFNVKVKDATSERLTLVADIPSRFNEHGIPQGRRVLGLIEMRGMTAQEVMAGPQGKDGSLSLADGLYAIRSREHDIVTMERLLTGPELTKELAKLPTKTATKKKP
jgi:hypothetical protein